jgi:hypothetical protein
MCVFLAGPPKGITGGTIDRMQGTQLPKTYT